MVASVAESSGHPVEIVDELTAPGAKPDEPGADAVSGVGGRAIERTESGVAWNCPVCGEGNAMSEDRCTACGTPFARLFQEPERRPDLQPGTAVGLSALWPGLGHWKLGRRLDGVARMVLFVWTFGTVLVLAFSRSGGGLGALTSLFLLFVVATLLLWVLSALDSYRIASHEEPLVGSRTLLWGAVALVVVSALLATIVAFPAARGR